jgi:hypothetical protein
MEALLFAAYAVALAAAVGLSLLALGSASTASNLTPLLPLFDGSACLRDSSAMSHSAEADQSAITSTAQQPPSPTSNI